MDTIWMLMARYEGLPIIPIETVRKDYFSHLTLPKLLRKIANTDIKLPIVKMEDSQKTAKGVHVQDLASYLDERTTQGRRESELMHA
ncbi:MAG: pyocin activator PrtN family protein [Sulfitobacter sp.]